MNLIEKFKLKSKQKLLISKCFADFDRYDIYVDTLLSNASTVEENLPNLNITEEKLEQYKIYDQLRLLKQSCIVYKKRVDQAREAVKEKKSNERILMLSSQLCFMSKDIYTIWDSIETILRKYMS